MNNKDTINPLVLSGALMQRNLKSRFQEQCSSKLLIGMLYV